MQNFLKRLTSVSVPAFTGRSVWCKLCGGMPRRNAVWVVVGAPLSPPPLPEDGRRFNPRAHDDDREAVDTLHREYVSAIKALHVRLDCSLFPFPYISWYNIVRSCSFRC